MLRFLILFKLGGTYLDLDALIIKSLPLDLPNFLGRESGTTQYALCNSAAQLKTIGDNAPVEDDNYGCDMLGIVINSTSDFFEIQTRYIIS